MTLYLADMADMQEDDIKAHIVENYSGEGVSASVLQAELATRTILIAYESVGNHGCDSASCFLFRRADGTTYDMIEGAHCSCFGFEGQGVLEPVDVAYLQSEKFFIGLGGYDDDYAANLKKIRDFLQSLSA